MAIKHPSPNCPLRSSQSPSIDASDHFLFECPFKYHVWQFVYYTYLKQSPPSPTNSRFNFTSCQQLRTLSSPAIYHTSRLLFPQLNSYQIFACTLQCIWQTHWRFIFDDTLFLPSKVIKAIARLLTQLDSVHSHHQVL